MHCVRYGTSESQTFLSELCQRGVEVSGQDSMGRTPLHLSCLKGDTTALSTLLEHGASLLEIDKDGLNALHYAARGGKVAAIQYLIESTRKTEFAHFTTAKDKHSRNALHHMLSRNGFVDPDALRCLLTSKVGVNDFNDEGKPPMATFLSRFLLNPSDKARLAELLFQSGADPSFVTAQGGFNLGHLSASSDQLGVELLEVLAKYDVDLRKEDAQGRTILHHCAIAGSLTRNALKFLCSKIGLSKHSYDKVGMTPLQHATERRQKKHHPLTFRRDRWSRTEQLLLEQAEESSPDSSPNPASLDQVWCCSGVALDQSMES